jgi:hypothetical protein
MLYQKPARELKGSQKKDGAMRFSDLGSYLYFCSAICVGTFTLRNKHLVFSLIWFKCP